MEKLDVYGGGREQTFVFVHGGGFVGGDKHNEGSPFYSNMGDFAARHGMEIVSVALAEGGAGRSRVLVSHRWRR